MRNRKRLNEGVNDSRTMANNESWFRDTPHYWPEASLPLAYAVACVEVVSKMSGKANYSSG